MRHFSTLLFATVLALSGCGEDKPAVEFTPDASAPDATPGPDAFVCADTQCGALCVDTSSDPANCGGCGLTCNSPGQLCTGSLPCSCPANFIPSQLAGAVMDAAGNKAGLQFAGGAHLITLLYSPQATIGQPTPVVSGALAPPAVAALYELDLQAQTARTVYTATGMVTFDTACATGTTGTLTDLRFIEVDQASGQPIEGGCSIPASPEDPGLTIPFAFGPACSTPNVAPVSPAASSLAPLTHGGIAEFIGDLK